MRLFMATLSTETNTFSPMPTGWSGFNAYFLRHGTATEEPPNLMTEALHVWRARAEALGWDVTESLTAIAEPAGPTVQDDDRLSARISGFLIVKLVACTNVQETGPVRFDRGIQAASVFALLHGGIMKGSPGDCHARRDN